MKTNTLIQPILTLVFALLPFAYLAYVWDTLPEKVALHFGINGQPDHFGSKNQLFLPIFTLMGAGLLSYALLKNIHKIDPKQAEKLSSGTFEKLGFVTIAFMSLLSTYIIHSTINQKTDSFLFTIVGLLLMAIGNLMHSLKPNYFAGIRIPWTLNNEENWRKTHQLASKIWVAGGLLIVVFSFIFSFEKLLILMLFLVAIMVLIPMIYSFLLFKKQA